MTEISAFRGDWAFLSNFYACGIAYAGMVFGSAEAAFQAMKCENAQDRARFVHCHPAKARKMGRTVAMRSDWETTKLGVMEDILRAKFDQHPELLGRLLATRPARLVEGNDWHDNFWGACGCDRCAGETKHNWLGVLLERVRAGGYSESIP